MDPAGRHEASLVRRSPSFLRPVWAGAHWRLLRVVGAAPLATRRTATATLSDSSVRGIVRRPGRILLRVHWTPYWHLDRGVGCLRPGQAWTYLEARRPGSTSWPRGSPESLVDEPAPCSVHSSSG
jgi:hypothetical protein